MSTIKETKDEIEKRRLLRQEKWDKVEDTLGFAAAKASGIAMLGSGILELVSPDVISAVLPQPLGIAGVGFALVAGKRGARLLLKALEQFI